MLSLRPLTYRLGLMLGLGTPEIALAAEERWEIAPAEIRRVLPAIILPGQAERITRAEFTTMPHLLTSLKGDPAELVGPTMGYRLRDVDVVDGVVYSNGMTLHLRQRRSKLGLGKLRDMGRGAMYESWVGNRWFGNWLTDDCLTYRLAETAGQPITTRQAGAGHVPRYEELLSMAPGRMTDAHLDEAILFDDHPNNGHRIDRAQDMRSRLLGALPVAGPQSVFLLRGHSGDHRILENEREIAERLERDLGFRIMFPEDHSVDDLMAACANAPIVAGVEGSQLNHGLVAMPPGSTLLTIQPPDRATTAMKLLTDRWQQRFAMVIAHGNSSSFSVDWQDLVRTVDLIHTSGAKNSS
ncbi:glycosyltransferase family 61 protein [Paracoccus sp. CPCC 101403]|uniref:Glycosyltransferase family 61 protein n=2 Tax=Paracoccus broussonetiae TaxID=3075834 RepID=A0ABU3EAS7_9RHOB|nr:glycosyltransferase family 61 protein [Paracoccus sp. CPCC 101403]